MLQVEHRQMYRSNGLIDDFVLHGKPDDYLAFASKVEAAVGSGQTEVLATASHISIEIAQAGSQAELFTSLQNRDNEYLTVEAWKARDILRVYGNGAVLEALHRFLLDLSTRGEGYSYLSEYSETFAYSRCSPQWRLHVNVT